MQLFGKIMMSQIAQGIYVFSTPDHTATYNAEEMFNCTGSTLMPGTDRVRTLLGQACDWESVNYAAVVGINPKLLNVIVNIRLHFKQAIPLVPVLDLIEKELAKHRDKDDLFWNERETCMALTLLCIYDEHLISALAPQVNSNPLAFFRRKDTYAMINHIYNIYARKITDEEESQRAYW